MQSCGINYTGWIGKEKNNPWMFPMKVLQLVCCLKLHEEQKPLIKNSAANHNQVTADLVVPVLFGYTIFVHRCNVNLNSLLSEKKNSTSLSHPRNYPPALPTHLLALLPKPASRFSVAACAAQSSPGAGGAAGETCWLNPR